jgi:hypothetical protein
MLRGGDAREVDAEHYGLVARPPLLQRFLREHMPADSREIYRQVQVASGTLERSGRRNRYQVKEREQQALSLLMEIGTEIPGLDGSVARIADIPVEVRV